MPQHYPILFDLKTLILLITILHDLLKYLVLLKNLVKLEVIEDVPKSLTPKLYLEIEEKMKAYCKFISIPMDSLDLLLWYKEAGEIFK